MKALPRKMTRASRMNLRRLPTRYGEWLDEGMEHSTWSGAARLVFSVGGACVAVTALLVGVFALLGWV